MRHPSPEKQCDDCSLCCKIMAIPEIGKAKGVWCDHVVKKGGCGIYATRPQSCRTFQCLWLKDPRLPEEWKPSRSKFVIAGGKEAEIVVHVDANSPGAWRKEPYLSGLRAMAHSGQSRGGLVVIVERGESTVLLPDREVKVGALYDDERLVCGKVATPSGPRFEVKVMKAGDAARLAEAAAERLQRSCRQV
jgi:hypothetical protein